MSFLSPNWLFLSVFAIPIIILYMLRLRRQEVKVPSTMLWETAIRDRQANTPWQRLKKNLLMFLQLLLLAALVFGLSRPAIPISAITNGSLVVLLDATVSMQATDVHSTRFEAARAAVNDLIVGLPQTKSMSIIEVALHPKVIISNETDHEILHDTLSSVEVTYENGDWQTAFALAAGAASALDSQDTTIVIVSDGGFETENLPPLPVEVKYIPIGNSTNNLAISALALRKGIQGTELFTSVTNYDQQAHQVILSIYLDNDLITAQQLEINSREVKGVSLTNFPTGKGIVTASLSPVSGENFEDNRMVDDLAVDDSAQVVNIVSNDLKLLLVTQGNFFLEQFISTYSNIKAYRNLPQPSQENEDVNQFILPEEVFDLYLIDQVLPSSPGLDNPVLPKGNLLLINPPSNEFFSINGDFTPQQQSLYLDHPLTRHLNWDQVHIKTAKKVTLPSWAEVLVDSNEGPLVFVGETEGRRIAVLTFDLHESDLPLQISFPILFANLFDYLLPSSTIDTAINYQPGDLVEILIPPGTESVSIVTPKNDQFLLAPSNGEFYFDKTQEIGFYTVIMTLDEKQTSYFFTVNMFNPEESNIRPAPSIQVGRTVIRGSDLSSVGYRDVWPWLIGLAICISLFEWWYYHRQIYIPKNIDVQRLKGWISRRKR